MTGLVFLLLAQAPNPYLSEGRALAKAARFAEAIAQLKVARQVPDLRKSERLEVLELLGRCQVAEGRREEAEAAYAEALGLEPGFELDPQSSPKLLELFGTVKQRLYPEPWLKLEGEVSAPGEARVRVIDPYRRAQRLVFVSRVDGGEWRREPVAADDGRVRLSLALERPARLLEWYLEAEGAQGEVLARYASASEPNSRRVDWDTQVEVHDTPRLKRVPAWVAMAVAVAAAGAGGAMQSLSQREAHDARDRTRPPGDWADTARAAQGRAVADATWATGLFVGAGVAGAFGVVLFAW